METTHRVHIGDSRDMSDIADAAVDLVVTSPPYPMIEMWDGVFADLNPEIDSHLAAGAAQRSFDLMHAELRQTWGELSRVLTDGGIACINIGDATRKVDGDFRVFPNHAKVIQDCAELGFVPLPDILWRKPVNSTTKFMGSGMIPPNAYATLEHEYLLIFRKGDTLRSFESGADRRYNAAYFWEERNEWFSDLWEDVLGEHQTLPHSSVRQRSGAFPFEIPYRLINMYSVYGDTVLDPFWGTGTTSLAAMVAARNSIGYELEREFTGVFEDRVNEIDSLSRTVIERRIRRHIDYVESERDAGTAYRYKSAKYGFPVKTKQEKRITMYAVEDIEARDDRFDVRHADIGDIGLVEQATSVDRPS